MPDPTSPFDDPFADLFGKLPDPRERRSATEDAAHAGAQQSTPAGADASANQTAPLSRREAREAAARQAASTGRASDAPAITAVSAAPSAASPMATPTAPPVSAPSQAGSTQAASTPATMITATDEEWPFFGASAAPAAPSYSRGGESGSPRPVATATHEDLFTGAHTTDSLGEVPPPKDKRKRRIAGWIALGVVLLLLGGMAAGGLYVWTTYEDRIREFMGWEEPKDYDPGLANGEAFVTISPGDTGAPISESLFAAGVTKTPDAFYDYLIDTGQNPPFVPGVFQLQKQMTSEAALAALLDPANKMENSAQLREGLTVEQSLPLLAEGIGLPLEDFQAAVADPAAYGVPVDPAIVAAGGQPLEGWLFPATYTFDPGVTATEVIATLVNRTVQSLDSAGVPVEDRQRVLTLASIIEKEARFEEDFYKVSRVIENRMDPGNQETFGLLQMDSTAQYGFNEADGTVSTSAEAQYDDNPWNTYVVSGLPIGPIANPGDVAIDAAMHPADGDWLYFVTVNLNTGETVFTNNLADHNRATQQWIAWCADNPDAGC
jgi:UPF0755 protein